MRFTIDEQRRRGDARLIRNVLVGLKRAPCPICGNTELILVKRGNHISEEVCPCVKWAEDKENL